MASTITSEELEILSTKAIAAKATAYCMSASHLGLPTVTSHYYHVITNHHHHRLYTACFASTQKRKRVINGSANPANPKSQIADL